jgi:hypothetical protein
VITDSGFGISRSSDARDSQFSLVRSGATGGSNTHPPSAPSVVNGRVNDADQATQHDAKRRDVSASGDAVEVALTKAVEKAAAARRWDVVVQLARELEG